jgi:putative transposase
MSMSRKRGPWDSTMMASFFGWLTPEWIDIGYTGHAQSRMELLQHIEMFYDPTRRHSALNYLSPAKYVPRHDAEPLAPMNRRPAVSGSRIHHP